MAEKKVTPTAIAENNHRLKDVVTTDKSYLHIETKSFYVTCNSLTNGVCLNMMNGYIKHFSYGWAFSSSTDKTVGYLYSQIGPNLPTAGGVNQNFAGVGDQDLSTISSADTFTSTAVGERISGHAGDIRNAYTVIDSSNNPVAATEFVLPFQVSVYLNNKSVWAPELGEGILSLSSKIWLI